ncbi:hypothetical protein NQ317_000746 [Molorchus minor]|uniref:Carboxypeptidase n=1 Tax=Molorchus minor TaxID=1323400 RepID=A0ABQ9JDT5_9CUCU|nr:hypothetical protein NQ317_000746 [Molorchus minor]
MFWWLHYTTANVENVEDRPLVIWLQGGPGASSTGFGNFAELGPLDVNLQVRNTSWDKYVNVLFVDNPVGTGYSYVDTNDALTTTNKQIAEDFVEFLKGFYEALPLFKDVPLYIFSESYGGKMTAEIALVLYQAIQNGQIESKFKGIGLGDSWISPIDSVLTWAPYLLTTGVVDKNGYEAIMKVAEKTKESLEAGNFVEATELWGKTERAVDVASYGVDFYNILTKIKGYNNNKIGKSHLHKPNMRDEDYEISVLMNGQVKEALNIDRQWGENTNVFKYLTEDFMKPVTDIVEKLLNTTDIKWVDNLHWSGKEEWISIKQEAFAVDNYNEGYVKKVGNLAMYSINRSGHMVPSDNPAAMNYILKDVTNYV